MGMVFRTNWKGAVALYAPWDQVIHELLDGADRFRFIDGDVGFLDVRPCPFQVRAGGVTEAACVIQTGAQRGFCGGELAEKCLPMAFNCLKIAGVH